jgi:hypothetical protein
MKKLVVLFAAALFFKLVVFTIFTQTPAQGQGPTFEGWLYDLNILSIAILAITIPLLTRKVIQRIK